MFTIKLLHSSDEGTHDHSGQLDRVERMITQVLSNQHHIIEKLNNMSKALDDLNQAIADQNAAVLQEITEVNTKVDALLAQIADGATAEELTASATAIKDNTAKVQGIVTPDTTVTA